MAAGKGGSGAVVEGRPPTGRPSDFIDVDLMKALANELRVRIYAYLCEHPAGSPEVAKALGESKNTVRMQVAELAEAGWLEAMPSPGRTKIYQARRPVMLPADVWDRLPEAVRGGVMSR